MAFTTSTHTNGGAAARPVRAAEDALPDRQRTAFDESNGWANSAPLALAAFAVCAFMLSMVNAHVVDAGVTPYVWGVALMFGGATQLIAGIIQLRTGDTFAGVLFSAFGAFWLSLFAIVELFQASVPVAQRGHALGLFLYAFAGFTLYMLFASFRTNVVTVAALVVLDATLFLLASGNYFAHSGVVTAGGWTGLVLTALAAYLSFSAVSEASYGRQVVPIGDLSKR
jgi:succinate-acetate transporter protein